ncbi:MAG: O-antigen ligase family protein, partial [Leptospiraceae bacterium]|nr:O-antigen ligase family protein [Leptospiraceae bacterium]
MAMVQNPKRTHYMGPNGLRFVGALLFALFVGQTVYLLTSSTYKLSGLADLGLPVLLVLLSVHFWRKLKGRSVLPFIWTFAAFLLLLYYSFMAANVVPPTQVQGFKKYYRFLFYVYGIGLAFFQSKGSGRSIFLFALFAIANPFFSHCFAGLSVRSLPAITFLCWCMVACDIRMRKWDALILIGTISVGISCWMAPDRFSALLGFQHLLLPALFFLFLRRGAPAVRPLSIALLVYVISAVVYAYLISIYFWIPGKGNLLSGFSGSSVFAGINVNSMGIHVCLLLSLCAALLLSDVRRNKAWALAFLLIPVLAFTNQRSAIVCLPLLVVLLFSYRYFWQSRHFSNSWRVAAMVMVALGILALAISPIGERIAAVNTIQIRLHIWSMFLSRTLELHPWLGVGAENWHMNYFHSPADLSPATRDVYFEFIKAFGPELHAHNLIIGWFYSFGFLGTLLLFLLFSFCAYRVLRMSPSPPPLPAIAVLSVPLITGLVEYTLADAHLLLLISAALAIVLPRSPRANNRGGLWLAYLGLAIIATLFSVQIQRTVNEYAINRTAIRASVFRSFTVENCFESSGSKKFHWSGAHNYYDSVLAGENALACGHIEEARVNFEQC